MVVVVVVAGGQEWRQRGTPRCSVSDGPGEALAREAPVRRDRRQGDRGGSEL